MSKPWRPTVDDYSSWWSSWWGQWWVKSAIFALLSSIGGALGYIMRSLDKDVPVSFTRAMVEGMAAGFVGLLVMLMCNATNMSDQWTGVIVGVAGWLGANASIRMLERLVFKKLGLSGDTAPAPLETKLGDEDAK